MFGVLNIIYIMVSICYPTIAIIQDIFEVQKILVMFKFDFIFMYKDVHNYAESTGIMKIIIFSFISL